MSMADVVNVVITTQTAGVAQAGFGVPLILSPHTRFSDRVRHYTDTASMALDNFDSTTPEYKAAARLFGQTPRPEKVAIGRRDGRPTQRFTLAFTPVNGARYAVKVNGATAAFVADDTPTAAEIAAGLNTQLTGLAVAGLTNAVVAEDNTITLTATTPGTWFDVETLDAALVSLTQGHPPAGGDVSATVGADLDAILAADSSWYGLVSLYNSAAEIAAIAEWAEANEKLFVAQTVDSAVLTTATDDVASTLKNEAYARTALIYANGSGAFADAAWLGRCLPLTPGSETWKFKTLAGVPATALTTTQRTNAKGKNANVYVAMAGLNITEEGVTSSGAFIDVVRGRDKLKARIAEGVFGDVARLDKLAFTDRGIAVVGATVRAELKTAVAEGFLAEDPAPVVNVPKAADVPTNDKAARRLTGVTFTATLAGAIHSVLPIQGTVQL